MNPIAKPKIPREIKISANPFSRYGAVPEAAIKSAEIMMCVL